MRYEMRYNLEVMLNDSQYDNLEAFALNAGNDGKIIEYTGSILVGYTEKTLVKINYPESVSNEIMAIISGVAAYDKRFDPKSKSSSVYDEYIKYKNSFGEKTYDMDYEVVNEFQRRYNETLPIDERIAIALHQKQCHSNHTDQCSWYYEIRDLKHDWNAWTHETYLSKAKEMIRKSSENGIASSPEDVLKIIDLM